MRLRHSLRDLWVAVLAAYLFFGCIVPFTHRCSGAHVDRAQTVDHGSNPSYGIHAHGGAAARSAAHHCLACLLAKSVKTAPGAAKAPYSVSDADTEHIVYGDNRFRADDPSLISRLFRGPPA